MLMVELVARLEACINGKGKIKESSFFIIIIGDYEMMQSHALSVSW